MTTYLTDNEGKFIPATQRPDGTWRKARRIKDGYVPQEEVPLYESKGKQFAQRKSTLPPGFCPIVVEQARKDREKQERAKAKKLAKQQEIAQSNAVAGGNQKKQTKQLQAQMQQQIPGMIVLPNNGATTKAATAKPNNNTNQKMVPTSTSSTSSNEGEVAKLANHLEATLNVQSHEGQEIAKKLKKLRKKLREIEMIEERIKSGELKKPEKDQMDKVKRKREILKEIKQLEKEEASLQAAE